LALVEVGYALCERGEFLQAERLFRNLVKLRPDLPMGHNNLGWLQERREDFEGAIVSYQRALELNPSLGLARRNLASLLFDRGRFSESLPHWTALVSLFPQDRTVLDRSIDAALRSGQVELAADQAARYAALTRQSVWHELPGHPFRPPARLQPTPYLTQGALRHDIEQLRYLRSHARIGPEFDPLIDRYERALEAVGHAHPGRRARLSVAEQNLIGDSFNRIINTRPTPALAQPSLSTRWRRQQAEDAYLQHPLGLVVIDDFLSEQALGELRAFCLESTIWFENRYAHDRLGAFFRAGFNCPLLVQIANELTLAFPRLIGQQHPLLQMWAFKYGQSQPETAPHADFAAVNVNFWITPDEAALDGGQGGLTVYDVEAPPDWDFDSYNRKGPKISQFLRSTGARAVTIPHRSNRAVIFNSDLFHATAPFRFRGDYENRRINVTMLYGTRASA